MDPFRIAVRVLFAYVFLLALLRLAGKRVVGQASPFDFVLALVLGDLVDNVLWQEVSILQFAVASITLLLTKLAFTWRVARRRHS